MLKVYRNVFVVLCIAALAGMFVGTVTADYIYDFDTHVGQTLTAGQSLTGQDNWEVRTGNSAYKDNIWSETARAVGPATTPTTLPATAAHRV